MLHILYVITALASHLSLFLLVNRITRVCGENGYELIFSMKLYIPLAVISIIPIINIILLIICLANIKDSDEELLYKWTYEAKDEEE